MRPPRTPEFLARRTYRLRRLMDAARLLPAIGFLLLLLPLLRPGPEGAAPPTAGEGVYLFMVWGVLVLAAFVMSLWLRPTLEQDDHATRPTPTPPPAPQPPLPRGREEG